MQAVVTGGTGTKAQLPDGRPAAGKTGTTDQHGDAWFIGFTPQLTTAVWMGSPESVVPMNNVGGINVFGGTFPALLWHNYMAQAMDGLPVVDFLAPQPTKGGKFLQLPTEKKTSPGTSGTRPPSTGTTPTTTDATNAPAATGDGTGNGGDNGNGGGGGGGNGGGAGNGGGGGGP
jgi:membrane peptidoglycan carboxypeptidase